MFDPKNLDSYLIKCYAEQLETFNSSLQRTPFMDYRYQA